MDHRHTVLLVEDTEDVADALRLLGTELGLDVDVAQHGQDALEKLRGGYRPCLILLDVMMPVMDGIGFREAQVADPALRDIPIVATSAFEFDRMLALGVPLCLKTPLDISELLGQLNRFCTR